MTTDIPTITLNDGRTIPQLGFGVFQVPPPETRAAVTMAIEAGYRHIDTAQMYGNEKGVGEAIADSGLDRSEFFLTSKLSNAAHLPDDARRAFDRTLEELGTDHLDLFLIHWPLPTRYNGDFVQTWLALEEFYREGRARSIGVSNFTPHHLGRLRAETQVRPAVNQIEIHPYLTNEQLRAYNTANEIANEAYSPIAQGEVLSDPTIESIAREVSRTPAQVVLRWHIQRGDIIFPKSKTEARVRENAAIFDFELDAGAMAAISSLDKGEKGRTGGNPDTMAWIPEE
ncbi:aldo/keto reductase [Actinoplanes sp. NBRC 103695]|uniref:aldo/keto reductase n=1 Tax=Actinoplanes sp. NBRC 103695 TaxID=3032202 RepID=UPI0024A1F5FB|nr:aldo/keto reductase [Actinoplanes sp. NBRC 103695]GLY95755.1 oxidoreductase [Actinoplanes sp. NBRC 103695]